MKTLIIGSFFVLMLISSSFGGTVFAKSGEKQLSRKEARKICLLLNISQEKPIIVEGWMKDPSYFTSLLTREIKQKNIPLSYWMYDFFYFHPGFRIAKENKPAIEIWMSDPAYFNI